MNKNERKTMVACMEFIARNLNDEFDLMYWLEYGVADGDMSYERFLFDSNDEIDSIDEYYISDAVFAVLMDIFLNIMRHASKNGGLYCDNVTNKLW